MAPATTATAAVTAHGVDLAWGTRVVLRDASFALATGTITALVGPNGAGKSTLLHAIAGLLAPARGTLDVPARGRPGGVAYVLQSTTVNERLPLTVREAVTIGRYAVRGPVRRLTAGDRAAIEHAMEAVAVADLARRQLHELSGGQRQRVFVAQGLAQEADLLLLDEPVTGLDVVSQDHIARALDDVRAAGRAVVISTHSLGEASRADCVLLVAGRVVAAGPPSEVITSRCLAEAYGGHLIHLEAGSFVLDDPHHHAGHAHDGHTGPLGHHGHEH